MYRLKDDAPAISTSQLAPVVQASAARILVAQRSSSATLVSVPMAVDGQAIVLEMFAKAVFVDIGLIRRRKNHGDCLNETLPTAGRGLIGGGGCTCRAVSLDAT